MDTNISFAVLGIVVVVSLIAVTDANISLAVLGVVVVVSLIAGSEYPSGYTNSFNGSRYKFVDSCQGVTQSDAQSDCERDCSHLVFVETKEENDFLVREASRDTKYWIGLFSPKRHLFWDNGNQVTFVNLDRENPETFNSSTGCFKMSNTDGRYWVDKFCGEKLAFICEYEGSGCPYNATEVFNNSCYDFVDVSPASRISAKLKCENDSSHLVFIESKEENDFLVGKAHQGTEYWIGLHDRPQLFWENGNQMTFVNIDQSTRNSFKPRSGCYRMSNLAGGRRWLGRSCENTYFYICEYKGNGCVSGFNKSFNGSCYKFVESDPGLTRSAAQSDCERDSSHLVFIETKEESDFLDKESTNKQYWIGLFSPKHHLFWDNNHEVTFVNINLQDQTTYKKKTSGCYKMPSTGRRYWLDASCEEEIGYICEFKDSGCPYDANVSFNNSCYKFVNDPPASRISAQLKCKNDSSHLVFIESKEENDFLVGRAQNNTEYWIGLHDRPQIFWEDGKEVSYANIDAGQDRTFGGRTGCYQMSDHEGGHIWFNQPCGDNSGYICEYEGK